MIKKKTAITKTDKPPKKQVSYVAELQRANDFKIRSLSFYGTEGYPRRI